MNNFLRISKRLLSDPSQGICSTLINTKFITQVFSTGTGNVTIQFNSVAAGSDTLTMTISPAAAAQRDQLLSAIIDASAANTSNASSVYTIDTLPNSAQFTFALG